VLARNQTCIGECPPGQFANRSGACAVCNDNCLTCEAMDTYCKSCVSGLYVTWSGTCRAEIF
jgi:hypothetical protein